MAQPAPSLPSNTTVKLSSLAQWSVERIAAIFEAATEEDALKAIAETFPDDVHASLNGSPLPRPMIDKAVLAMRPGPKGGLKVVWKEKTEAPTDSSNRNGAFGGYYHITGILKPDPETKQLVPFVRHKIVTVKIQSQSEDLSYDSRKITELVYVACDHPTA
ncbi:hypothetical protein BT96DRAFT_815751 [Gymnopus androsaceus JB14]|uniref:Uncharacterized protein n=1 Tax=Gymnopus androsaceus JB14 TaxID=1447944 RepID=A0A6A4HWP3_9AGAR|nr:hypothetical protein BT96DRAFT_815751 [Gymnopus androsaceus JB14]